MRGIHTWAGLVCLALILEHPVRADEGGMPGVTWPAEWTAFGSVSLNTYMWPRGGTPARTALAPGDMFKTIPAELELNGQRYPGRRLALENGQLEFLQAFGLTTAVWDAQTVYLAGTVTAERDTTVEIGAGAGWFMQWWLDGQPVFDTLAEGNVAFPITGRDHVFPLALSKGEHVLAVAVVCANIRNSIQFRLALTGPQAPGSVSFPAIMEAGRRKLGRANRETAIDFQSARSDFQRALKAATTDTERAEALLAMAECRLDDIRREADPADARRDCEAAAALSGATPGQKARAALGIGESLLRDNRCAEAREAFARAAGADPAAGWAATVRFAVARSHLQEGNDAAARPELEAILALEGLEDYQVFNAQSHLDALDLLKRLEPEHPRLFFNVRTWPAVKARAEANPKDVEQLREAAARLPADIGFKNWGTELATAAFVYRLTGDAALLEKIRRMLRASVEFYMGRLYAAGDLDTRLGCVAALDWTWNELPADERTRLVHDLLRDLYGLHVEDLVTRDAKKRYSNYNFYYAAGIVGYAALTSFHPDMDPVDRVRAMALLGRFYHSHIKDAFARYGKRFRDAGTSMPELEYSLSHLPVPIWSFLHCWRSALQGEIPEDWTYMSGIKPDYILRNMLEIRPGHEYHSVRHFGFGRSWHERDGWSLSAGQIAHHLAQFIHFFGRTHPDQAASAAFIRARVPPFHVAGGSFFGGVEPLYPFLLDLSAAPPPELPKDFPLASLYRGNGQVLMSSGFGSNDTYAVFCCGAGDPDETRSRTSEHFDSGHFTIFKRGYLALDSGTRAQHESSDPRSGVNYEMQSVAHNTVLIHMPGESLRWNAVVAAVHGGQRVRPFAARPLAFESEPRFAYAAADLTETYHPDKCAQMLRQFLYLPPDHFVVFDRAVSKQASYPKAWLLHTANEPLVAGKEVRADQEQGRLFCRTLLPADAVLEPVGGPGKEFWAGGQNWPVPTNSPYLRDLGMANAADIPENMGRWRVNVKPGAARTDDCFLHLLQTGLQTAERMVESRMRESAEDVTLEFEVAPRAYSVTFRKTGAPGGHVRIVEDGRTRVDKEFATQLPMPDGRASH